MTVAVSDHFAFGENWKAFSAQIDERRIALAREGMEKLVGAERLRGKTLLDIGCGSGLHALAALQLGARSVHAIDVDPVSVSTTKSVLAKFAGRDADWTAEVRDVFDTAALGTFDIVYSWGVLHHTGDVKRALNCAAAHVAEDGLFCVALYAKTPFCWFWKAEKRVYAHAPSFVQKLLRVPFLALIWLRFAIPSAARGKLFRFSDRRRSYSARGMDFDIDVHDWMGGYPYESMTADEVRALVGGLGFAELRSNIVRPIGLLGSGCSEFVFRRAL